MEISLNGKKDSGKFVLANDDIYSGAYFTGTNVQEVLGEGTMLSFPESGLSKEGYEGTVPGLPVNGSENGGPELSHIELQNGLMSHQNWRNWTTFMEAELAALQDLGLKFDRKQLFGHSIYASGSVDEDGTIAYNSVDNDHGYFARENGEWVEGTPNETPLGIGLHIYGSYNDVTQVADLLTIGEEAVGIRVEGVGNKLTVAEGTRIQADGTGGSALLVSYGKEHTINLMGEATALGEGGIAARFDFGDNILGNDTEYRGSWMWAVQDKPRQDILSKIDGALVKAFNVSGSLKGSAAAIYIAENAFVEEINILSGAELEGDIVSFWDPQNKKLAAGHQNRHYTTLTFGRASSEDGTPIEKGDEDGNTTWARDEEENTTWEGDENFALDYAGDICGDSIDMTHVAGRLSLAGSIKVHTLENNAFLALTGSDVSLPQVTVADKFVNDREATLETGFDGNGEVNSILAGSAELAGTLVLRPLRDFYASNTAFQLEAPVKINDSSAGASITGTMTVALAQDIVSPTLSFVMKGDTYTDEGSMPTVTASRDSNAYSQYAQSSGAHATGRALDVIAGKARGDMQDLLAALDWSAPDGSGIADGLKQLGPGAYDAVARASLAQQNEFNLLILRRLMATMTRRAKAAQTLQEGTAAPAGIRDAELDKTREAGTWQFWATPTAQAPSRAAITAARPGRAQAWACLSAQTATLTPVWIWASTWPWPHGAPMCRTAKRPRPTQSPPSWACRPSLPRTPGTASTSRGRVALASRAVRWIATSTSTATTGSPRADGPVWQAPCRQALAGMPTSTPRQALSPWGPWPSSSMPSCTVPPWRKMRAALPAWTWMTLSTTPCS